MPAFGRSETVAEVASPIDAVLASGVAEGLIPGAIAIAATSDGIIYDGAAGVRDMSGNRKMTVDTIVRIASMTKAISSAAVMQLVEQGMIELDQPDSDHLPQLKEVQILEGFDADDKPIVRPAKTAVCDSFLRTIQICLTSECRRSCIQHW